MNIWKKVKIAALSVLVLFVVLFAVLVHHIVSVQPIENASIQISRIDFEAPLTDSETAAVTEKLRSIEGVKSDIIVKKNVVVYYHDNTLTDSRRVFAQLMDGSSFKARPFQVPAAIASKQVCPVIKKDSLKYKFARFIRRVFT